ncbi:unnamed protein product [Brassicogethes aeneus]|uniref:Uncharacterized protein n=1 Tax=Brassicogethes aeneus TaxID=1431903 RepID=A0A9P0FCX3_BRAAE|nr:unnamed protein product [Brassicogethes aeneus]
MSTIEKVYISTIPSDIQDIEFSYDNRHELNLRILQRRSKDRLYDFLSPNGKYRDENYEIYKKQLQQFKDAARKYNRLNEETLVTNKKRLNQDYILELECDFLKNTADLITGCPTDCHCRKMKNNAVYTKIRTLRKVNYKPPDFSDICCVERWMKRKIILEKFVNLVRKVIIQNRASKNLQMLKTLNKEIVHELELKHRKCCNESYGELFEKFVK